MKILEWDSNFFGFKTAQVSLKHALELGAENITQKLLKEKISLLYIFHNRHHEVNTHQKKGFLQATGANIVDTKITYQKKLPGIIHEHDYPKNITEYNKGFPTPELYDLAIESGNYSRFKTDNRFPENTFEQLYKTWIKNSVNGKIADKVLVAVSNENNIAGMVTISLKEKDIARIGLIAVNKHEQGNKWGQKLMIATEYESIKSRKTSIEVATQEANRQACNFYHKSGYHPVRQEEIYHLWNTKTDKSNVNQ